MTIAYNKQLNGTRDVEEELLKSEQCWDDTINSISDIITVHDLNFNIVKANKAAKEELNIPELKGISSLKCHEYYHGTKSIPESCPSCNCHEKGVPVSFEIFEPHLNKYIEVRALPRFDSDNNFIGSIHIVRDISERKKAEEKIRESEHKFETIFENAPDAMFSLDLKGNILDGNTAAEIMTGYKKEELIGENFIIIKLIPTKQMAKAIKNLGLSAMGKSTGPDEYAINRKDGTQSVVEIRTFPVKIDSMTQVLGIARDITKRKETEAALKNKVDDLQRFYEMSIGREVKMKGLKKKIAELEHELDTYRSTDK